MSTVNTFGYYGTYVSDKSHLWHWLAGSDVKEKWEILFKEWLESLIFDFNNPCHTVFSLISFMDNWGRILEQITDV